MKDSYVYVVFHTLSGVFSQSDKTNIFVFEKEEDGLKFVDANRHIYPALIIRKLKIL